MAKKTAPSQEQDITETTGEDAVPLSYEELSPYERRFENIDSQDEFNERFAAAIYEIVDLCGSEHAFVANQILNTITYKMSNAPKASQFYQEGLMGRVKRKADEEWENSGQNEIDSVKYERQKEYYATLGENKILMERIHRMMIPIHDEHASHFNFRSYGYRKAAPSKINKDMMQSFDQLAATYGAIPKTTEEQIAEAEQVAA